MSQQENRFRGEARRATRVLLSALFLAVLPALYASEFENLTFPEVSQIRLPEPRGRWEVGTVTYHWIDETRRDLRDDRARRQIIAQLWYPAEPSTGRGRAAYFPGLEAFRLGLAAIEGDRPARDAERFAAFDSVVVPAGKRAAIARDAGRLPVILFSPGGNMSRHFHTTVCTELASHGYVVAVMSHKYSTWDVFPAGGFSLSRNWFTEGDPEGERLTELLASDARLVLDRLERLNESDPAGRFTDRIDLTRVAIAGHSRGGKTVARTCARDPRVRACITLDNVGPASEVESGLRKPQLTLRTDDWDKARVARLRAFLGRNPTVAREVILEGATHNDFSDLPIVDPEGSPSDLDQTRSQPCIATLILRFLTVQLETERGSGLDLDGCTPLEIIDHGGAR